MVKFVNAYVERDKKKFKKMDFALTPCAFYSAQAPRGLNIYSAQAYLRPKVSRQTNQGCFWFDGLEDFGGSILKVEDGGGEMGGWLLLFFSGEVVQCWPRLLVELRAAIVKMVG